MISTLKPQAARQLEARARARHLGVRTYVIEPGRHYVSRSRSARGVTYRLDRTRAGWTCDCPGYLFSGVCKHLGAIERRSEREGWTFGKIAPLPWPPRGNEQDCPVCGGRLQWIAREENDVPGFLGRCFRCGWSAWEQSAAAA